MFVNMLEKCALGSSSMCSEKQFCSEITFQMDEGDPHQITNTRGILILAIPMLTRRRPERREPQLTIKVESAFDTMVLVIKPFHSVLDVVHSPSLLLKRQKHGVCNLCKELVRAQTVSL